MRIECVDAHTFQTPITTDMMCFKISKITFSSTHSNIKTRCNSHTSTNITVDASSSSYNHPPAKETIRLSKAPWY